MTEQNVKQIRAVARMNVLHDLQLIATKTEGAGVWLALFREMYSKIHREYMDACNGK